MEDLRAAREEVVPDLEETDSIICTRVNQLLDIIKNIQKRINSRKSALLDYDKVYNSHEQLVVKEQRSDLTVKQAQQMFSLERKLEENKLKYNAINDVLKKELPYFFKLVGLFISSLQEVLFFKQLTIYFQVNLKLQPLRQVFEPKSNQPRTAGSFGKTMPLPLFAEKLYNDFRTKNDPSAEMIDSLAIINFRENFLRELTGGKQAQANCKAIFSFKAQEEGDLSIEVGDIIRIIDKQSGWWQGELNGKIGMFPSNYVKKC